MCTVTIAGDFMEGRDTAESGRNPKFCRQPSPKRDLRLGRGLERLPCPSDDPVHVHRAGRARNLRTPTKQRQCRDAADAVTRT